MEEWKKKRKWQRRLAGAAAVLFLTAQVPLEVLADTDGGETAVEAVQGEGGHEGAAQGTDGEVAGTV